MTRLIEQTDDQGASVHLETEQVLNWRGRVVAATLRVVRDGTVVWEGDDTRETAPQWRQAMAARKPAPAARRPDGDQ